MPLDRPKMVTLTCSGVEIPTPAKFYFTRPVADGQYTVPDDNQEPDNPTIIEGNDAP